MLREFRNTHMHWIAASAGDVPTTTPETPSRRPWHTIWSIRGIPQRITVVFNPPCRKYRCNDDKELDAADAADPPSIADQNSMFVFTSNARDRTARSFYRDAHSVKAELASMIFHVDGDDNGRDTEGR